MGLETPWIWFGIALVLATVGLGVFLGLRIKRIRSLKVQPEQEKIAVTPETVSELIPDSRYIEVNGINIHYVQAGDGPDVVLLHGIGASVFVWRFLFPLLQTQFRVTALDLPGFGKSSKYAKTDYGLDAQTEAIAATLSRLGITQARLVGSSMGGAISFWLAKKYPKVFKEIAVISPATESSLIPAHIKHISLAAPVLRRALNKSTMKFLIRGVVTRKDMINDAVVDAYLEPFTDKPGDSVRAFWSATSLLSDKRLPTELEGLEARTLIIYGKRDLLVSQRSIKRLLRILPKATSLFHESGGHHLMEDDPAWLARELESFFTPKSS